MLVQVENVGDVKELDHARPILMEEVDAWVGTQPWQSVVFKRHDIEGDALKNTIALLFKSWVHLHRISGVQVRKADSNVWRTEVQAYLRRQGQQDGQGNPRWNVSYEQGTLTLTWSNSMEAIRVRNLVYRMSHLLTWADRYTKKLSGTSSLKWSTFDSISKHGLMGF